VEGDDEDEQAGGVEEPVGRRPQHRLAHEVPLSGQDPQAVGHPLDPFGQTVAVQEGHAVRPLANDLDAAAPAFGERHDHRRERAHEQGPRRRCIRVEGVEAVREQRHDEG
jgi:hypothetical protein